MPENRIGGGRADEARLNNVTEPTAEFQEDCSSRLVRYRTGLVVVGHGLVFAIALFATFLAAYNFRWTVKPEGGLVSWFFEQYLPLLALALPVKLVVFQRLGQYRGSWRYVGIRDLYALIRASLASTALLVVAYLILENVWQSIFGLPLIDRPGRLFPQSSVFLLDWSATIAFVATARILVRFYYEDIQPQRSSVRSRVLIVGAGDAGEAVLRELLRMRHERYQCVGFVDDDASQLGASIHGVEIRGRTTDIHRLCTELNVQEVFIAVPHATPKLIRGLVERCEGTGVKFRTIPTVTDLIEGRVQVSQIRDVDIADLLGRAPVELDRDEIGRQLRGKRVLVTGAGGSIGSEMCRQIAAFSPARLVLVERAEHALFEIDRELRKQHPELDITPLVCDVCDRARLDAIFHAEQPSIVIHAAAHKHVPMMEANPGEAIKNNIGGTFAVAEAARRAKTAKMVVISTDKAVNPTSVMGCTKRVAEMFVQTLSGTGVTQFITVRFGNVLGSSGSVVPIFKRQIAEGGPVMVTHPDMRRYFMTIPEAAQLVLQAGVMGKGGEIYVLHMGEPVRIVDLARDMITLSGLRPGVDIDIAFSGVRPGEKLFEELSSEDEHIGDTAHPKIGIWKLRPEDARAMQDGIDRLLAAADTDSEGALQAELKRLVPEYTPDPHGNDTTADAATPARKSPDSPAIPLR